MKLLWEGLKEGGFYGEDVNYCSSLTVVDVVVDGGGGVTAQVLPMDALRPTSLLALLPSIFTLDKQCKGSHPTIVVRLLWYYELARFFCHAILHFGRN